MATGRRFQFGVVGEGIRSGEQLAAEARRAEALGYATLLLRDRYGFSYYVVSDEDMEALGPVVDRLAGR
jgi:alkanesulfonate monooxygenase SsuD/methylene tetrahydromethanopterin reductase-like flavin-dependent oxidoreductase (luciferase family)